jgi:hypothetical protein
MAGHLYSFALKKRMRTAAQKVGRLSIVMKSAVLQMQDPPFI